MVGKRSQSAVCLPQDMKHLWQIFVLWVFWVLIMWLMAPCLDPKPELPPQGKPMVLVPRHCNCPWLKFRRSGCPSETLNDSLCYHRAGERNRFATCYEKALEHLMGATESMTPDTVLWWLSRYPAPSPRSSFCCFQGMNSASGLGKMWEKLFKVIPRPSASHFHIYCGTCALMGHSQTLWGPGLTSNVHQPTSAFGMNEGCVQGFETVGNQATGHFIHPGNASNQGSWRKLLLLLLQFPGLVWTSDALREEDACFRFGSEKQGEGCQDWEGVNRTKSTKEILCAARKQEWKSATVWRVNSLSTPDTHQSPHKS
ncbi:unnamed protein product [Nyctereutes procyonoides]|uniref:(raccoon dog) hypothetical protein n=1 Tax=Nyctereutes procyonoides TaxID=34880 RepID=A0A811Y1F6_NYCPR|nr:unnamed protein product [Nyctereutes procyonoides]